MTYPFPNPMPETHFGDQPFQLHGCRVTTVVRDDDRIHVDLWGGEGERLDKEGILQHVGGTTLTVHFRFDYPSAADDAEGTLRYWAESDMLLDAMSDGRDLIRLTNPASGVYVGTLPG